MAEQTEQKEAKPSKLPSLMVSGFVALVIITETVIFFFMVPTADDVAALAEARLINKVEASMQKDGEEVLDDGTETLEFPLGEFGVTFIPPGSTDGNFTVTFKLVGTIYAKEEKKLQELFAKKKARFEHRMMLEIRNATRDELTENQLGLIQRRILATSNEVLAEGEKDLSGPVLLGVSLPGFQAYEE